MTATVTLRNPVEGRFAEVVLLEMARSLVPPAVPGAPSDLAPLQAGAAASWATDALAPRVAYDEILGDIDVDRMERVMNTEVESIRGHASLGLVASDLVDHFTRNSPQGYLVRMRMLAPEQFSDFATAARAVMYEPGQTAVPQGYAVEVTATGSVRLVRAAFA